MLNHLLHERRFPGGERRENWPVPGSVGIQRTRRCGATACAMYTVVYPIRKILRLSEMQTGTRDQNHELISKYQVQPLGHAGTW